MAVGVCIVFEKELRIDASLSMTWANYCTAKGKAKVHLRFHLNRSVPRKLFAPVISYLRNLLTRNYCEKRQNTVENKPFQLAHRNINFYTKSVRGKFCAKQSIFVVYSIASEAPTRAKF